MKRPIGWISVFFVAGMAGCSNTVQNTTQFGGDTDPVGTAIGNPSVEPAEGHTCDIGIALRRRCWLDGTRDPDDSHSACMAFENNGSIAQVQSAIINGVALPWIDSSGSVFSIYTYAKSDTLVYGNSDSALFSYSGFAGDSFTSSADVAPSFGQLTFPDSISASTGCTVKYGDYIPGDSITIEVSTDHNIVSQTFPDTGAIVIGPNILPYDSAARQYGYVFSWSRTNWTIQTSSKGNRIGIWSIMDTGPWGVPAKP